MAISIQAYPIGGQNITMAHNPIEYVVTSTNKTQTNFKYIADVYWLGATEPVRFTMGVDPTYGNCKFDFSSVLRNVVTFDPPVGAINNFFDCTKSYQTLTVKFGEQYGASSALTNYINLTTHSMKFWNASLPIDRWWNGLIPTEPYVTKDNTRKFLTDIPTRTQNNPTKICYEDFYYLYFLQDTTADDVKYVEINTYDESNTLINTLTWDTAYNSTYAVQRLGCGAANLQAAGSELNFSMTGATAFDNTVSKYSVQLFSDKDDPLTEDFWFQVECECTWESPYRLCFLNKLGGYDFFNFNWNSKKTSTYEKGNFERKIWNWNSTGTSYEYNSYNRGKIQYSTIGKDKLQLTSGWLSEEQSTWLEELISSPDVYIMDSGGILTAVNVTDTNYDYKTLEYDQLFNLTVTLEFAYTRYRQSL